MNSIKYFALVLGVILCFVSCASKKDVVYFQGIDLKTTAANKDYSPVLKADDLLSITVSSIDIESAIPFNLPVASINTNGLNSTGNPQLQSYLIASDGTIEYPQLGSLHLAGLTRREAVAYIKTLLAPYLQEPTVTLQLLNFKITILGEVKKPGSYSIKNERITIVEALGLSGDMTLWGTRTNVLVIRENEAGKSYERIDLTSTAMFDSPVYYLQQNDVVYIEPNKPKINNSATSATTGIFISITSLIITVISLIVR